MTVPVIGAGVVVGDEAALSKLIAAGVEVY